MILSRTCQYPSVHTDTNFSKFTKETQDFSQEVSGKDGTGPLPPPLGGDAGGDVFCKMRGTGKQVNKS